jgi:hypothetical protein
LFFAYLLDSLISKRVESLRVLYRRQWGLMLRLCGITWSAQVQTH